MHLADVSWRAVFEQAAEVFCAVAADVQPERWGAVGLGEWSVRDLAGHTTRALLTIELYLARDAEELGLDSAVAYLHAASSIAPEAAAAIAERGRDAGLALGEDPAAAIREIADRVIALVERTADDATCATPFGTITLGDYLPTRTFELTVHTLDLASAIGDAPPDALDQPVQACLSLLAAAIGTTDAGPAVLLALTGRRPLPDDLMRF